MKETDAGIYNFPCQMCGGGKKSLQLITYLTWSRDQMISVPRFPAWVCDLCGSREFDPRAISWLNTLLSSQEQRSQVQSERRPGTPPGIV